MEATFGIYSLIPTIIVLLVAIKTKKIMEPLIVGTLAGFIILDGTNFFTGWVDGIFETMTDPGTIWTMMVPSLFGALIVFFDRSGGALAFANLAAKRVKTARGSLIATYILGIIVFLDEYLNALVVGSTMRGLTDRYNVPRETLAYTANTTGTPIAVLNPFSSWAVFTAGVLTVNNISYNGDVMMAYIKSIPFMFYAIVSLVICMLVVLNLLPKTKYLKEINKRAEKGEVFPESSKPSQEEIDKEIEAKNNKDAKLINFVLPLVTLVAATVYFDMDLVKGVMIGIATCIILYILNKTMTYEEAFDAAIKGLQDMLFLAIFIMFLFLLVNVNDKLGFVSYIIETVKPILNGALLPAITFVIVGLMGFCTGSFWGTIALVIPVIIPLAEFGGVDIYLTIGAIMSGATFGSHACFFGDAILLTSTAAQIKSMDQVKLLFPYALLGGGISVILYLLFGFLL